VSRPVVGPKSAPRVPAGAGLTSRSAVWRATGAPRGGKDRPAHAGRSPLTTS